MSNKTDKLNEAIAFIEANPEKINNLLEHYHNRIKVQDKIIENQDKIIDEQDIHLLVQDLIINEKDELIADMNVKIGLLDFLVSTNGLLSEREYSVYIHILPNKTIYIGQTRQSLKERWQNGRGYEHNNFFSNLIKKYGWNNIDHLLYKDNLTKFEADTIEKDLIKFYSENERITGRVVLNIQYNNK